MIRRDVFDPHFAADHLLFTAALGLALGLVCAGAARWVRGSRRDGMVLAIAGVALACIIGLSSLDASPFDPVSLRMKPYLSDLSEVLVFVAAGLLPAIGVFAAFAPGRPFRRPPAIAAGILAVVVVAGCLLYLVEQRQEAARPRHPKGTDTGELVSATKVIDGIDAATGLQFAPNGDVAVFEAFEQRLRIYAPSGGSYDVRAEGLLDLGEMGLGLDVAFHPGYPAQPYVWVTAEEGDVEPVEFRVFLGRIDGGTIRFERVLPWVTATVRGNHYGGALAVCDGHLFMSVGDGERTSTNEEPVQDGVTTRQLAQRMDAAAGKILRWEVSGTELRSEAGDVVLPLFAWGFRNPFSLACGVGAGELIVGENGPVGHDQVRLVVPGSNHEWPFSDARDALGPPLLDSGNAIFAPTGVAVRAAGDAHEILITTFTSEAVYSLPLDSNRQPGKLRQLLNVEGVAFAIALDAAGCPYFTGDGGVWRIDDGTCIQ